jgi:hypothetical protein
MITRKTNKEQHTMTFINVIETKENDTNKVVYKVVFWSEKNFAWFGNLKDGSFGKSEYLTDFPSYTKSSARYHARKEMGFSKIGTPRDGWTLHRERN